MWLVLAILYHVLSRFGYVFGVGTALSRQRFRQEYTRHDGVEPGFARFRRMASIVMNNDGFSFVVLCVASWHTLPPSLRSTAVVALGAVLAIVGLGTKVWAARTLGIAAYYWHNFFAEDDPIYAATPGPYRYIDNPMYTVGYLHTYGLALMCGSLPGVFAAAFDQAAILIFNRVVERPHFQAILARRGSDAHF